MRDVLRFLRRYSFALGASAYTFTLGAARSRHRGLIGQICEHFGYNPDALPTRLPRIRPTDVAPESTAVQVREPRGQDGNVSVEELVILARLARSRGGRALFEFGTFDGRTALNLACNAPAGATVFSLDLPAADESKAALPLDRHDRTHIRKPKPGARLAAHPDVRNVVLLEGDSATFDYSPYAGAIDMVFVDGSHSYPYVVSDTRAALAMRRSPASVIVWHDYSRWPGVTRALNEFHEEGGEFDALRWIEGTTLAVLAAENHATENPIHS